MPLNMNTKLNVNDAPSAGEGASAWGGITGTLSAQTDLQSALDAKQPIVSGVSSTEIGYLDGVTGAIQTQLNSKFSTPSGITTNNVPRWNGSALANSGLLDDGSSVALGSRFLEFTGSTAVPATSGDFGFGYDATGGVRYQVPSGYLHMIREGANEVLRIGDGSGNPGIFSVPATSKFKFSGTCLLFSGANSFPSTSGEYGIGYDSGAGLRYQVANGYLHLFYTGTQECVRVGDGGNNPFVGFGGGVIPTAPVHARRSTGAQIVGDHSSGNNFALQADASGIMTITPSGARVVLPSGKTLTLTSPPVPATATSTGVVGTIAWDSGFFYVCTDTNTWRRTALSSW